MRPLQSFCSPRESTLKPTVALTNLKMPIWKVVATYRWQCPWCLEMLLDVGGVLEEKEDQIKGLRHADTEGRLEETVG